MKLTSNIETDHRQINQWRRISQKAMNAINKVKIGKSGWQWLVELGHILDSGVRGVSEMSIQLKL